MGAPLDPDGTTYGITRGEFLLGRDGGARSLGSVESRLALDDRLARTGAAAAHLASDLGDGFPVVVRHL